LLLGCDLSYSRRLAMPADLFASLLAPKAAVAFAVADAHGTHGTEDVPLGDLSSHQVSATSFIHLPMPRSTLLKMLIGPEITAYNWLHDRVGGLWHKMFDGQVSPDQARMVEYYASSCPHCQHLEPVWKQAAAKWASDAEATKVVWQQKECLDEHWKPGADYKECQEQQILGFPSVKFFPPGAKTGDDFLFERTPESLLAFAKTGIHPSPLHMPREEGDIADAKLVDYYSAACPHCKELDPVWADTEKKWDTDFAEKDDAPLVSFTKKECYDDHWEPGKDYAECKRLGIQSFPSIKLLTPAEDGHGFVADADYSGARTPDDIIAFLKQQANMEEPAKLDQAGQHHDGAAQHHDDDNTVKVGAPPIQEEETRNEPVFAAPVVGKATINVAPTETGTGSDSKVDTENGTLSDLSDAVKTAMMPLPLVGLSCLPVRRSYARVQKRPDRSSPHRAPATPTQFL
jgi:thiol-disulfide isomerase/thioredoxin